MNILCKYKSFRRIIEKNWKVLQILGFILVLVLANQVIQPFFKPQIEEIITTPLYVKSDYGEEPIKEVNYYIVSKIEYRS